MSNQSLRTKLWMALDISLTLGLVATAGILVWALRKPLPPPPPPPPPPAGVGQTVSLEGAVIKGRADAKLALVIFSEFQCDFCARFSSDTLPRLERRYVKTGQVLLAFRHFPLDNTYPLGLVAAEIAACAADADQFWAVHNALFEKVGSGDAGFRQQALAVGLQREHLDQCLASGIGRGQVRKDKALGLSLKIRGTPTFLLGRLVEGAVTVQRVLVGSRPLEDFESAIDDLLEGSARGPGSK